MTSPAFTGIAKALACLIISAAFVSGTTASAASAPQTLGNMNYAGIYADPVLLADGVYEGEPFVPGGASRPRIELVGDAVITGGGKGGDAGMAFVLLTENSGGTGTRLFLAAVRPDAEGPRNVGTVQIGDRVDVIAFQADTDSDGVSIEIVVAGPDDPMCCPTLVVASRYGFENGNLVELSRSVEGVLGFDQFGQTLWRLERLTKHENVVDDVVITARFDDGRISGTAGCNRYFADVTIPSPGTLQIGVIGATKIACPDPAMALETRFLGALRETKRFGFAFGKLLITYGESGAPETMLLRRDHNAGAPVAVRDRVQQRD